MSVADIVLIIAALAFAWSMGAHYTGACMGMPYATRSISLTSALWTMAPLTLLGATFLSHKVLENVGHHILVNGRMSVAPAIAVIFAAFLLTTLFTRLRVPTSTIQILVFCMIGAGAARGLAIRWLTVGRLAVLWILAPFVAFALGYMFTQLFDRVPGFVHSGSAGAVGRALVVVGGAASLTMGLTMSLTRPQYFSRRAFPGRWSPD